MLQRFALASVLLACSSSPSPEPGTPNSAAEDANASEGSTPSEASVGDAAFALEAETAAQSPPSPCSAMGLLLCDDFEGAQLDAKTWTVATNHGGLVEVTNARAHSGARSLHVRAPATGGADAHVTETKTAAATRFFARAWLYLLPSAPMAHVALFTANGKSATYTWAAGNGTFASLAYFGGGETANDSATKPPIGKWTCLEWSFDGAAGTADYWLDGVALTDMNAKGWGKTTFTSDELGVSVFHDEPNVTYDLWYDDVAIGTARVGCP